MEFDSVQTAHYVGAPERSADLYTAVAARNVPNRLGPDRDSGNQVYACKTAGLRCRSLLQKKPYLKEKTPAAQNGNRASDQLPTGFR